MKRIMAGLLTVVVLFALNSCKTKTTALSGLVVAHGGSPQMIELQGDDGKSYGFIITDDTEIVWEDVRNADIWHVLRSNMYVTVEPGEVTESADEIVNERVEGWFVANRITVTGVDETAFKGDEKPVIYLYPETMTDVSIELLYDGKLTCTYPEYNNGWLVTASPDGTLTNAQGQIYNYLYWEGITSAEYDFSQGFCVSGDKTAEFLEEALAKLGLTRKEANEFIVYWLPLMQDNPYNMVSFQSDVYTEHAQLSIEPRPDTLLRIFMAWQSCDELIEIQPQPLTAPERTGFTVVEWGGAQVG